MGPETGLCRYPITLFFLAICVCAQFPSSFGCDMTKFDRHGPKPTTDTGSAGPYNKNRPEASGSPGLGETICKYDYLRGGDKAMGRIEGWSSDVSAASSNVVTLKPTSRGAFMRFSGEAA